MMKIIKKFKSGEAIINIRTFTDEETGAFLRVFVKHQGSVHQKRLACNLAEFIKDNDGWIQCGCKTENAALMTMGMSVKANYYLQRINQRAKHHPHCVFKGIDHPLALPSSTTKPCNKRVPLRLHRRGHINEAKHKTSVSRSNGAAHRYPRLARVLYSWVVDAALNQLSVLGDDSVVDRFQSLKKVADAYRLEAGINASKYLWTYPNVDQMISKLKNTARFWPQYSRPYAVCVAVVDSIKEQYLRFQFKHQTIEVAIMGTVTPSSGRIGEHSAPFLVIFTITDTAEAKGVYQPFDAFYVPVYSRHQLIPVDSVYERKVLEMIEQRARWWIKDKGLNVVICKPLFDIEVRDDTSDLKTTVRPDFLIETPRSKIVFEVMGSHEPAYLERKSRTIKLMQSIGEVIEFDALAADKSGCWDAALKQKISVLSALIFKGNGR
jgi:hypothetical protein